MFKVGDMVIANERAKGVYSVTKPGWVGTVVEVYKTRDYKRMIKVRGERGSFNVYAMCFDLYKDPLDNKNISRLI